MSKLEVGVNDLASLRPDLAKEWHPTKNGDLKPCDVTYGSKQKVWWYLPYDDPVTGKHFDFEWRQIVKDRTSNNQANCPYLSGKAIWVGYNDLKTWCQDNNRYDLIEQYSDKNDVLMEKLSMGSKQKVWWYLPYDDPVTGKHFDFEWCQTVKARTGNNQANCPYLSGKAIWVGYNDLVTTYPELVKEWHPSKNGDLQPCDFTYGSNQKVWWNKTYFDPVTHKMTYLEWEQEIKSRTIKQSDCPLLSGSSLERFAYQVLQDMSIQFDIEYKVDALKNKRFDIYVSQYNLIIELDGIQHFTNSKEFFEIGDTPFEKRIESDNCKNLYCLKNNIPILRIPYIYSVINDSNVIRDYLNGFLLDKIVPIEILDYYDKFDFSNYSRIAKQLNTIVAAKTVG